MKLLKSLSKANFGSKKTTEAARDVPNEDARTAKTQPRDSSTDLSSPTKSMDSKIKLKDRSHIAEPQNADLKDRDIVSMMSPVAKKKKKGRKSTKRRSSISNTAMIDDSIRSENTRSERPPPKSPKGKKGKKKKKKKGKGGSSRRSDSSTIRQSIMLTLSEEKEITEHTRLNSDREQDGGEAWLMNFGPNQAISASFGGPQPMPELDENDENDLPEEKSMKSGLQLGLPPNEDPMNDSKVSLADSCIMEPRPPIGELVVGRGEDDDDDVSEIGEPPAGLEAEKRTSEQSNNAPDDRDVCFGDRGHPGTRVMTKVIRNLLDENEHAKYTTPMGKLIRRKLRGRRFLLKQRQHGGEVYWWEADRGETDRQLAEYFKEESRRKEKGMDDDDSDENSSLQDSAKQSEEASLSLEELNTDDDDEVPPPPPDSEKWPSTPKTNNSSDHKKRNPGRKVFLDKPVSGISSGGETTSELLSQIAEQRKNAEDYALPFNSYDMMENGRKAEEKLQALIKKSSKLTSKTQENDEIRLEIHKMDLLVERVMYASIGPLLDMLEVMEETMNELSDEIDEPKEQVSPTNPKLKGQPRKFGAMLQGRTLGGKEDSEASLGSGTNRTLRSGSKSSKKSGTNHDSITSIGSGSKTNRTIRSGSKRSRDGKAQSVNHDSMNSFGSGSRRNMDQEGHPRGRSYFNESKLQASGVSMFDDVVSAVPESQVRQPQLSDSEDDEMYENFDEDMDDGSEVEVPLNDEVDYESLDESSGYSGSREKSLDGFSKSHSSGSSFGIEDFEQQLKMGNQAYTVPLKGGSSGQLSASTSFSSDAMTPKSFSQSNSRVHSFASIDENRSQGSQSLRMERAFLNGEGIESSQRSTKSGQLVEVRGSDDMSSIGNSHRRLYGSDSDDEEEILDMLISDVEEEVASLDSDGTRTDDEDDESAKEAVSVKTQTVGATRLEQFFDRLQHFFEARRKVEERAEIIDPAGKCRRIKMRCATKLLPKSNGQYGSIHQQRNTNNEVVRSLDELYATAAQARPALYKVLDNLTDEILGLDLQSTQLAELKPRDRAFEKAKEEYGDRRPGPPESWLCDVVRASVICKSYKQMNDVNKWLQKHCDVVKAKNRFLEPAFNGYRDLLFHVKVKVQGDLSHICEIQVHHRDMKALDFQFGMPKHYEFFRSSFAGPWRSQEDIMDDLASMNKYGDVGAMMVKLLRSKDPDQLRLFACLCREKLDEFDKALELYRRVLVLQSKDGDKGGKENDHETLADTHMNIGLVYGNKGEIDESLYHLQTALELQEEGIGTDNLQGAELMTEVGRMLNKKGDFEGALTNFEQALEIRENAFGNEQFMVVSSLQDIGQAFSDMGDFTASEVSYRKALKLQEKMLNDVHPDIATTSRLIGTTLCKYGDFGTAMELHRLALSIRETSLGKNHPMTAESQTDIGIVLCLKGDLENAEWRHRKALRIRELKGKEDEDCAISLSYLGDVLSRKGEYGEAISLIKRAKEIRENSLGMDHPVTAGTYIDLGNVYYKQGDAALALKEYRRAKVAREAMLGSDHQETAVALSCLGNALNLQGDYEAAHKAHLQALDIYAHFLGEGHPLTASGYQNVADTLLLMGDKEKALIQHRRALAIRANILSKDHPDTALSCARIGDLLAEKDDLVGALVAHRQALAITVGLSGEGTVASAKAHIRVGLVMAAQGEFEEAVDEFDQATAVLENVLGEDHEETARAYGLIGSVHSARGEFEDAFDMHSQAMEVYENLYGADHFKSIAAANKCKMAEKQVVETEF